MHHGFKVLALFLALALPMVASADNGELKFDDIRSQQAEIRAGLVARTGRFQDMTPSERTELMNRQTEVLVMIEGKNTPSELNPDQRTKVFNHLEWIEAAINKTADERLICERRATIGSNRKERVCRTEAQLREERERARKQLDNTNGGRFK